jgi:hypothetical protein
VKARRRGADKSELGFSRACRDDESQSMVAAKKVPEQSRLKLL